MYISCGLALTSEATVAMAAPRTPRPAQKMRAGHRRMFAAFTHTVAYRGARVSPSPRNTPCRPRAPNNSVHLGTESAPWQSCSKLPIVMQKQCMFTDHQQHAVPVCTPIPGWHDTTSESNTWTAMSPGRPVEWCRQGIPGREWSDRQPHHHAVGTLLEPPICPDPTPCPHPPIEIQLIAIDRQVHQF